MEGHQERSAWTYDEVVEMIRSIPEVASWSDFDRLLGRPLLSGIKPSWEYVCHAGSAFGSPWQTGFPGAAAVLCLHYSIHLVDDVLDEDPKGLHHGLGLGATFNLATAFQAAAGVCLSRSNASAAALSMMHSQLHEAVIGTGFGQYLDALDPSGEDEYWRIVGLKTPPLFRCALFLGTMLAGAGEAIARRVSELGVFLGEIAQINDDLGDALARPATADWQRRHGCLPILYARISEHPERDRFHELADRVGADRQDIQALEEAQDILVRSGAVSYCAFRLAKSYRAGVEELDRLELPHGESLLELFDYQARPLRRLFERLHLGDFEQVVGIS